MKNWMLFICEVLWIAFALWVAFAMEKETANRGVIFAIFLIFCEVRAWRKEK